MKFVVAWSCVSYFTLFLSPANKNSQLQGHLQWFLSLPPCLTHFLLPAKEFLPVFYLSPSPCFSLMPCYSFCSVPNKGFLVLPLRRYLLVCRSLISDVQPQGILGVFPHHCLVFTSFRWLSSLFFSGPKYGP